MSENERLKELRKLYDGWRKLASVAATATAAIALHLASSAPERMAESTQWFLSRPSVTGIFYAALAAACLNFVFVYPRWKHDGRLARKVMRRVMEAYSGLAGALLGWAAVICGWTAMMDSRAVGPAVGIMLMVSSMVAAPFFCDVAARVTVISLQSRMFVPAWRLNAVRVAGWTLFLLATFGAYYDLVAHPIVSRN